MEESKLLEFSPDIEFWILSEFKWQVMGSQKSLVIQIAD